MKPRVYLETTIISYLTARPSRDLIVAAHQELTREWWEDHRHRFELFVSEPVIREASRGDADAAARRLGILEGITELEFTPDATALSQRLVAWDLIPPAAAEDSLHVAVAVVQGMDYLLTWNFRHLANGEISQRLAARCRERGYGFPHICTPEELMGEY